MYGFQVNVGDQLQPKWVWVKPTNGQPYQYETKEEAERMKDMCYPCEHNHKARVKEF